MARNGITVGEHKSCKKQEQRAERPFHNSTKQVDTTPGTGLQLGKPCPKFCKIARDRVTVGETLLEILLEKRTVINSVR
jgi:hypothetical protein